MSTPATRAAARDELGQVTAVFAHAFADDPVWGHWTFPEPADRVPLLRAFWQPFVRAASKYDGVVVLDDLSAVALWVPPGVPDLDDEDEAAVADMLPRVCGDRAGLVAQGWDVFAETRPQQPHWYLSLLATDPGRRGSGLGMTLVEQHLSSVDDEGHGAYLESTNPGNVQRYRRAGFEPDGFFDLPDGPRVDRMWRAPR
jgi:GNAT superfamily N-acetyltransferase